MPGGVSHKTESLHRQIARTLTEEIREGIWPAGGVLPAEPELARRFGVSRMTVRQALQSLAEHGLLIRHQGRPTRVAVEPIAQSLGSFYSFTQEMERLGREHHSHVVERGLVRTTPAIRDALGLTTGEAVAQITLVRFLGTEPIMVETATFRAALLPVLLSDDVTCRSLYDLIAEAGVTVTRAVQRISPIILTAKQARLLETTPRRAGFLVRRTSYAGATPVEVRESIVRGDCYSFVAELQRDQLAASER